MNQPMMDDTPFRQNGQHPLPDDEINLREVWNILFRNKGLIFGCVALVVALAAAYTMFRRPVYQASTSIRIDEEKSNVAVLDMLESLSTGSEVETEMEELRSRTLAEKVVQTLGLRLTVVEPRLASREEIIWNVKVAVTAPAATYRLSRNENGTFSVYNETEEEAAGTVTPGQQVSVGGASFFFSPEAAEYQRIVLRVRSRGGAVRALRGCLSVTRPNPNANFVTVRCEHADTVFVHAIPNTLARHFIARRQQVQKTEARSTVEFLSEQIDTLRAQLIAAEDALQRFREGEQVVSLEAEASAQVERLVDLQAKRDEMDAERAALARLLNEIRATSQVERGPGDPSPYRRLIAFPSLLRNQATGQLLNSLAAVESQRAELLNRRTFEHPDVQALTQRIRDLEEQLRSIAVTYLDGLTNEVASLDSILARFGNELEQIPAKEVQFARLQRQASVLEEIYTLLQTRLKEAQIAAAVEDPSVRIVDPAIRSTTPIEPRPTLNLAAGLVVGLMLGIGLAFTREYMDTTVHTRDDVRQAAGVTVLGLIPRIPGVRKWSRAERVAVSSRNGRQSNLHLASRLVTGYDRRNPVSEAYRTLRTNITFSNPDRTPRTMVFTSPLPGDGKSTSASNLAITLTQQGLRVLLVDADMRKGLLNTVFDVPREPGLSNVLFGKVSAAEAIQTVDLDGEHSLDFLPTGTLPPNPAELLGSAKARALLERLEQEYDTIILDAPPLNVVTDAALLGTNADGVVLVARANVTQKSALTHAVEQLRHVRAPIIGALLNDVDFKRDMKYYGEGYGYNYQYYYGVPEDA